MGAISGPQFVYESPAMWLQVCRLSWLQCMVNSCLLKLNLLDHMAMCQICENLAISMIWRLQCSFVGPTRGHIYTFSMKFPNLSPKFTNFPDCADSEKRNPIPAGGHLGAILMGFTSRPGFCENCRSDRRSGQLSVGLGSEGAAETARNWEEATSPETNVNFMQNPWLQKAARHLPPK